MYFQNYNHCLYRDIRPIPSLNERPRRTLTYCSVLHISVLHINSDFYEIFILVFIKHRHVFSLDASRINSTVRSWKCTPPRPLTSNLKSRFIWSLVWSLKLYFPVNPRHVAAVNTDRSTFSLSRRDLWTEPLELFTIQADHFMAWN